MITDILIAVGLGIVIGVLSHLKEKREERRMRARFEAVYASMDKAIDDAIANLEHKRKLEGEYVEAVESKRVFGDSEEIAKRINDVKSQYKNKFEKK